MGPKFAICTITERYEAKLQDSGNLFTNNGSSTQSPFMLIQELIPNKMARTSIRTRRLFILTRISIFADCDVYVYVFKVGIFLSNEIYKIETRKFWFLKRFNKRFQTFPFNNYLHNWSGWRNTYKRKNVKFYIWNHTKWHIMIDDDANIWPDYYLCSISM